MARKESVTKSMIAEAAFQMAREEGIENVTARKLATKIGCSTQPIFRVYAGMNELLEEVWQMATDSFAQYYLDFASDIEVPFVHLGLAYINFAVKERKLFKLLFQSEQRGEKSLYELLNGQTNAVGIEINKAVALGCQNPSGMFMKMWIFIHGCACMVLTGDYDLTDEETIVLLSDIYKKCA